MAAFEKQFQAKAFPRVFVSAITGEGVDRLKRMMVEQVQTLHEEVELFFPKSEEHRIYELGRETQITRKEPASAGTVCLAHMTPTLLSRWRDYLVSAESVG